MSLTRNVFVFLPSLARDTVYVEAYAASLDKRRVFLFRCYLVHTEPPTRHMFFLIDVFSVLSSFHLSRSTRCTKCLFARDILHVQVHVNIYSLHAIRQASWPTGSHDYVQVAPCLCDASIVFIASVCAGRPNPEAVDFRSAAVSRYRDLGLTVLVWNIQIHIDAYNSYS